LDHMDLKEKPECLEEMAREDCLDPQEPRENQAYRAFRACPVKRGTEDTKEMPDPRELRVHEVCPARMDPRAWLVFQENLDRAASLDPEVSMVSPDHPEFLEQKETLDQRAMRDQLDHLDLPEFLEIKALSDHLDLSDLLVHRDRLDQEESLVCLDFLEPMDSPATTVIPDELELKGTRDRRGTRDLSAFLAHEESKEMMENADHRETKETRARSDWRDRKEIWDRKVNAESLGRWASMELKVPKDRKALKALLARLDRWDPMARREKLENPALLDIQEDRATKEIREHRVEMEHQALKESEERSA